MTIKKQFEQALKYNEELNYLMGKVYGATTPSDEKYIMAQDAYEIVFNREANSHNGLINFTLAALEGGGTILHKDVYEALPQQEKKHYVLLPTLGRYLNLQH